MRLRAIPAPQGERVPGTGLGLAVAKRIVEAHSGRLLAESRPGEGSVFRIDLPRSS